MRPSLAVALATSAGVAAVSAKSLDDVCTLANVKAALPSNGTLLGINVIPSATTVNAVSSDSTTYCNVTVAYTHPGKDDTVTIEYAFPAPSAYKNRFYVAGGFGYSL
ncbi:Tannase/feruloyl esterase [Penicillium malachiteum]|nr:Tannase/feruloyl esterase [Penicillium malachiteum]